MMSNSAIETPTAPVEEDAEIITKSDDDSSESGSRSGEEERIEWLATTRERRSNAGNRYSTLLKKEEADDDLELLFAEDEDDAGFEYDAENLSDVQMDSSDDEDDHGPAAADNDLEGETVLQKEAKAERMAKKRKANAALPSAFRKKVKIDPTLPRAPPAPRPKKKSERASWIPTPEDAPIRASVRATTQEKKRDLHEQMIEREKHRQKQVENMKKAAARKEAEKPKRVLKQADRLAEAAKVEKRNAKSLNRWEESEKLREEEQAARLAALANRMLEGPVITWWSGVAHWVGGKLKKIGKNVLVGDKPVKPTTGRRRKILEIDNTSEVGTATPALTVLSNTSVAISSQDGQNTPSSLSLPTGNTSNLTPLQIASFTDFQITGGAPAMPLTYAGPLLSDGSLTRPGFEAELHIPAMPDRSKQASSEAAPLVSTPEVGVEPPAPPPPAPQAIPQPPTEYSARHCLILENFNEAAVKLKDNQLKILFKGNEKRFHKAAVPKKELCVIFGTPAKYHDPSSGLPYCNSYAYKEIQRLKRGDYRWSTLLQAYVGQGQYPARGVPARFMGRR